MCTISKTYILFYFLVWWNVQVWQLWPKSLDGWTVGRFFIFLLSRMWWEMQNKRYFFTTCTLPSPKCELIFCYIRSTLGVLFLLSRVWWEMQNKRYFFTLGGLWEDFGNTLGVLWECFFCCPECDEKCRTKDILLQHALCHHPNVS